MAVISIAFTENRAVAAIIGLNKGDVGVALNFPPSFWRYTNKRIIARIKDVSRNFNLIDNIRRRSARIVIGSAVESRIEGSNFVVEVTQTFQATQSREIVLSGETSGFISHAGLQLPQKILLVKTIDRIMKSVGRSCQIHCGTNCGSGAKLVRSITCPLTSGLQYYVAAH